MIKEKMKIAVNFDMDQGSQHEEILDGPL